MLSILTSRLDVLENLIALVRTKIASIAFAHGWADNTVEVDRILTHAGVFPTLVGPTVTPTITGRFRVTATVRVGFVGKPVVPTYDSFTLGIGHSTAVPGEVVTDYETPVAQDLNITNIAEVGVTGAALVYETIVALPLGVPVQLGVYFPSGLQTVCFPAHGAQVAVEELSK